MILTKEQLLARLALGAESPEERLAIVPMLDVGKQVGDGSIDLRLGTDFLVPRSFGDSGIDPTKDRVDEQISAAQERVVLPLGESLWLHPGQMVLGSTLEFVHLPRDCAAYVVGRSSWGRIGLLVATAVFVQPGWAGSLTLELVNEAGTPIRIQPGLRVAQLVVHQFDSVAVPYQARFARAIGPQPAKLGWDRDEVDRIREVSGRLSGARAPNQAAAE
jgi:dCTP deaminase